MNLLLQSAVTGKMVDLNAIAECSTIVSTAIIPGVILKASAGKSMTRWKCIHGLSHCKNCCRRCHEKELSVIDVKRIYPGIELQRIANTAGTVSRLLIYNAYSNPLIGVARRHRPHKEHKW